MVSSPLQNSVAFRKAPRRESSCTHTGADPMDAATHVAKNTMHRGTSRASHLYVNFLIVTSLQPLYLRMVLLYRYFGHVQCGVMLPKSNFWMDFMGLAWGA